MMERQKCTAFTALRPAPSGPRELAAIRCKHEGFRVTEENDKLIEEDSAVANDASYEGESEDELMDDGEEMGSEEYVDSDEDEESLDGDLTPNDIFGLDPLDVLTLEELADYLKVSPAAARRVIKEQNLPGKNIGGEWRFLRDAVANWLRGQEAPAQQQQKARTEFAKAPAPAEDLGQQDQYSRPPRRPFQAEQQGGPAEYRPRQRFSEGGGQYGGQQGGQYGGGGGQYGSGGQGQYGGGGGGQYGSYSRPPRRQFGSTEGGGGGGYGNREAGGGYGGGAQGGQFGGGGYGGQQRFGGAAKRKNKRQVFDDQRGKRLDRRKDGDIGE